MSEYLFKQEHLQVYTGILISHNQNSANFKMALKVEDNPVLEMSSENIESSIELEFMYDSSLSKLFFHNKKSCPIRNGNCPECNKIDDTYFKFVANLNHLQVGDTFRIEAALVNNRQSELPVKIHFGAYKRIIVACVDYQLRLNDTTEGIKKKMEIEKQREQREREEEDRQRKEEDKRKREKKWNRLDQWLAKYPNNMKIGVAILGTTVLNQLPNIVKIVKYLYSIFISTEESP